MSSITISPISIDVTSETAKNGKKYQKMVIAYKKSTGGVDAKTITSYGNKEVWQTLENHDPKDPKWYTIESEKNDGGYWEWVGISRQDTPPKEEQATNFVQVGKSYSKPTYETPEERERKQILIVRQNALTNAVNFVNSQFPASSDRQKVLEIAKFFEEEYVLK